MIEGPRSFKLAEAAPVVALQSCRRLMPCGANLVEPSYTHVATLRLSALAGGKLRTRARSDTVSWPAVQAWCEPVPHQLAGQDLLPGDSTRHHPKMAAIRSERCPHTMVQEFAAQG